MVPVVLSWSGGKDSTLALHALRADPAVTVVGLLTTVTAEYDRISMHGVRRALLERQAASLRLPLHTVELGSGQDNAAYEAQMSEALARFRDTGVLTVAFGDIFLEDVRQYRETMVRRAGMSARFPLWGRDTAELAEEFIALGFQAVTTCVDTQQIAAEFVGRSFDQQFLRELPSTADPCGENGEFHTFVSAGPNFTTAIDFDLGEQVLRESRFQYCDLVAPSRDA